VTAGDEVPSRDTDTVWGVTVPGNMGDRSAGSDESGFPDAGQSGSNAGPLTTGVRSGWSPEKVTEGGFARSSRRKLSRVFVFATCAPPGVDER